jgi:hypothetical protein
MQKVGGNNWRLFSLSLKCRNLGDCGTKELLSLFLSYFRLLHSLFFICALLFVKYMANMARLYLGYNEENIRMFRATESKHGARDWRLWDGGKEPVGGNVKGNLCLSPWILKWDYKIRRQYKLCPRASLTPIRANYIKLSNKEVKQCEAHCNVRHVL